MESSICKRSFFLLVVAAVIWLFNEESHLTTSDEHRDAEGDNMHALIVTHGSSPRGSSSRNRCVDPEDVEGNATGKRHYCQCPDPAVPARRRDPVWDAHHLRLVRDAVQAKERELETGRELNVVFVGDSITERWNGTRGMGTEAAPEFRQVFDRYFGGTEADDDDDDDDMMLRGMALGTSGDICVELLWHLQNGMLPDALQPDVFVLLIGTNDLGRTDCSKRNALDGILRVAEHLRGKRPGTPVIVHGLLPRSDVFGAEPVNVELGRRWKQILWINRELKKACNLHDEWHYLEANQLFLQKKTTTQGDRTQTDSFLEINQALMTDALHPSVEGYDLWAPVIVEKIRTILNDD
jgi:lysophospholipase L1-like esterase